MDTIAELKDMLEDRALSHTTFFVNPDYLSAIIGLTDDGKLIYDYEKMVDHLIEKDGMTDEEAIEFIEHNTVRTIPYMGESHPIILTERL